MSEGKISGHTNQKMLYISGGNLQTIPEMEKHFFTEIQMKINEIIILRSYILLSSKPSVNYKCQRIKTE